RHVEAPVTVADARLERPLERDARPLDRGEERFRDGVPALIERLLPGHLAIPRDARAGALDQLDRRGGHLGPDPVAGNERPAPGLHRMPSTLCSWGRTRTSAACRLATAWNRSSSWAPIVRRVDAGSVSGVRKSGTAGSIVARMRAPSST